MATLKELGLTDDEIEFVKAVYLNPGCKYPAESSKWFDDGTEYGDSVLLYTNPEKLGVIKCVGSYKWVPVGLKMELTYE